MSAAFVPGAPTPYTDFVSDKHSLDRPPPLISRIAAGHFSKGKETASGDAPLFPTADSIDAVCLSNGRRRGTHVVLPGDMNDLVNLVLGKAPTPMRSIKGDLSRSVPCNRTPEVGPAG